MALFNLTKEKEKCRSDYTRTEWWLVCAVWANITVIAFRLFVNSAECCTVFRKRIVRDNRMIYLNFEHHDISGLIDFLPGLYSVQSYINCYMLSRNKKLLGKQILKFLLKSKEENRLSVNNNYRLDIRQGYDFIR